jgi:DNA-binding SARP family transcriptional activator
VDAYELDANHDDELDTVASRAQLCCGEFLAGFPSISNPFDEWVLLQRSKANNAITRLLGKLASLQIRHGQLEAALSTAQQLVSLDPLREDSHRLLMEIYAKAGRRAEALRQYETCAQILKSELNVVS